MDTYRFTDKVRQDEALRDSFNALTRATFWFDFEDWYAAGHWGDLYVPHAMTEGDRIVSNVSVNHICFDLQGVRKNYIQLGTVMTDEAYRGQGLNRRIMEKILREYAGKVDGVYLFGNDSVVQYYPKFGFRPVTETEYYLPWQEFETAAAYTLEAVEPERLYEAVRNCRANPNDGFYMCENLGLYQFWCAAEFEENVYYLPEEQAFVIAAVEDDILRIHQIVGQKKVDLWRLAASFGSQIREMVLGFTPADRSGLCRRLHQEEDCTLFVLGEDLDRIEDDGLIFPTLSHA